jgi:ketopantoate reductase
MGPDAAANVATVRQAMQRFLTHWIPRTELHSLRRTLLQLACDADYVLDLHCDCESVMHFYCEESCWSALAPLAHHLQSQAILLAKNSGSHPFDECLSGVWWRLSEALARAGFKSPVSTDLRSEIWLKLWGNLTFNPVSALTHATLKGICTYPLTRALALSMMTEAQTVAEKLGVRFRISIDKRIAGAEAVGEHKTSMLQDVERGRALELEALLGSVVELARITETPTPHIDAVYACTSLLGATLAAQGGRLEVQPL